LKEGDDGRLEGRRLGQNGIISFRQIIERGRECTTGARRGGDEDPERVEDGKIMLGRGKKKMPLTLKNLKMWRAETSIFLKRYNGIYARKKDVNNRTTKETEKRNVAAGTCRDKEVRYEKTTSPTPTGTTWARKK